MADKTTQTAPTGDPNDPTSVGSIPPKISTQAAEVELTKNEQARLEAEKKARENSLKAANGNEIPTITDENDQPANFESDYSDRHNTTPGGRFWVGNRLVDAENRTIGRAKPKEPAVSKSK